MKLKVGRYYTDNNNMIWKCVKRKYYPFQRIVILFALVFIAMPTILFDRIKGIPYDFSSDGIRFIFDQLGLLLFKPCYICYNRQLDIKLNFLNNGELGEVIKFNNVLNYMPTISLQEEYIGYQYKIDLL
jgi:hypothetical protein